jgi:hypothetical protein
MVAWFTKTGNISCAIVYLLLIEDICTRNVTCLCKPCDHFWKLVIINSVMSSYVSLSRFTNKETLLFYILRKICVSWQPKLYPKKMSACQLKLWTIVGNTFFSLAKVKQDLHYIFITFSALHWLEHFDVHPFGQSKFNV